MKILLANTYDIRGGAAQAANRLHQGLRLLGEDAQMLVDVKESDDETVITANESLAAQNIAWMRARLDALPWFLAKKRGTALWSPNRLTGPAERMIRNIKPDIVNLHWVGNSFITPKMLTDIRQPIVWTLHDMWAFTGGCHYSDNCQRYTGKCGACPQLRSGRKNDLSRRIWKRKNKWFSEKKDLVISAPSRWLADCARQSSLFAGRRVEVIPYGVDTELWQPIDKKKARMRLGLPQSKKLVLFGAVNALRDRRKGIDLLLEALNKMALAAKDVELVIFGAPPPAKAGVRGDSGSKYKRHYLGHIAEAEKLRNVYSAADVFISPSREENLSCMIMESLACGTPVAAFRIGGNPDMIEHQKNGYIAKAFDTSDLARGIEWIIQDSKRQQELSERARQKVEQEFTMERYARDYLNLFRDILKDQE